MRATWTTTTTKTIPTTTTTTPTTTKAKAKATNIKQIMTVSDQFDCCDNNIFGMHIHPFHGYHLFLCVLSTISGLKEKRCECELNEEWRWTGLSRCLYQCACPVASPLRAYHSSLQCKMHLMRCNIYHAHTHTRMLPIAIGLNDAQTEWGRAALAHKISVICTRVCRQQTKQKWWLCCE